MSRCLVCSRPEVERLLELGPQPVTNRFPHTADESEFAHPMTFGACRSCGTAQLLDFPPASELKPLCDWIAYNEPEPHLDGLADRLAALPGIGPDSVVLGVTAKDDSLLRRLRERGISGTRLLDPREDLGEPDPRAFVETIQGLLTPQRTRLVAERRGRADLVIARHIFEHAHDPASFFDALAELIKPGGRIVLEAPDCGRALRDRDYSMLWEEHSLYLTADTFARAVKTFGADIERFENHPYALEDSMVVVARPAPRLGEPPEAPEAKAALEQARRYATGLDEKRRRLRAWALEAARDGGKLALFGAGHLGAVWINVLGLRDLIAFIVDDNAHKKGLRMPGSRLPIVGSDALLDPKVSWALMAFHPGSEESVIAKNRAFTERGGRFASIFPGSPRSLEAAA